MTHFMFEVQYDVQIYAKATTAEGAERIAREYLITANAMKTPEVVTTVASHIQTGIVMMPVEPNPIDDIVEDAEPYSFTSTRQTLDRLAKQDREARDATDV